MLQRSNGSIHNLNDSMFYTKDCQRIWQGYEVNWIEFKECNAVGRAKSEGLKS